MGHNVRLLLVGALGLASLVGCAQTSRVADDISPAALNRNTKAVAVMRIGAAGPDCLNVGVLLGVREGTGYRRHQVIGVASVRTLAEPAVAEVELAPGEYHLIGYSCVKKRGAVAVADDAGGQIYRTSYASFTVQAGEIINVGFLRFNASHVGRSAFGRPLRLSVAVTDWPLAELDQFKQKRPHIYAHMKTRLMTVHSLTPGDPSLSDCDRMRALKAQGKLQSLSASCQLTAPAGKARVEPKTTVGKSNSG